jgi:formate C-acetyltransferase
MRGVFQPHPLRSCLIEGCLEKGRDYRNGGPLYNHGQILAEGIADTGDSLYAIKKLVYDEKKYTMEELVDALNKNFDGYEKLYHDFKNCEKFGNDIEEVDSITARALNRFFTVLKRNNTYRGGVFTGGCSPFNRAANYGKKTAALPNGKLKGEPLLADSIAATPGRDTQGPTSQIKSVLKFNHFDAGSGFVFQNKFQKKMFNTEKGKASFIALAKAFFAGGGQQYTISVVSPEDLLQAKEHPENHRNLIVRVGGYSDYFVNLTTELQDNVIKRTFMDV